MAKKYSPDIFDMIGEEAMDRINALGLELLERNGYDTKGALDTHDRAREVKRLMRSRGDELRYSVLFNSESGSLLFFYELYSNGRLKERSRALRIVARGTQS